MTDTSEPPGRARTTRPRTPRHRAGLAVVAAFRCAVGLSCLAAGCGGGPLELQARPRTFTPRDYERVYEAWTRSTEAYSIERFSDVLRATATWQGWEFRWAYVVRYAEDYDLSMERRSDLLRANLADAAVTHRFFITMSGSRIRETDLTAPETAWRLLLVASDGRSVAPVEIEKVVRPGAVERTYFPSVSPWRLTFRVAFPTVHEDGRPILGPDASRATLRFAGALGTVDLEWALRPAGAADDGAADDAAGPAAPGSGPVGFLVSPATAR